jgi:hypothetical protein
MRHDRSVGIESVEQQHDGEPGKGLLDACRQPVKGLGLTILLALLATAWRIFEKLAHQGDDHAIVETQTGLQDVDVVFVRLLLLAVGVYFRSRFAL